MRIDDRSEPSEQKIVDFINALPLEVPFDPADGRDLADRLKLFEGDAQVRLAVRFLRRFEDRLDWGRFRKLEREAGRIEESERNPWEVEEDEGPESTAKLHDMIRAAAEKGLFDQGLSQVNREGDADPESAQGGPNEIRTASQSQGASASSAELNRRLRESEEKLGLAAHHRERILAKLGKDTKSPLQLQDLLPQVVFPLSFRSVPESSYDPSLHVAVKEVLDLLGPENRRLRGLVAECGSILARQFPREFSSETLDNASFYETVERAERYCREMPDDLLLLLWRGVLARWEQDDDRAFELANNFWQSSDKISVEYCRRVLWLCRETTCLLGNEMRWTQSEGSYDAPEQSIFETPHDWLDREEPLITAFVRRAVSLGTWDADCLSAYLAINTVDGLEFSWWYTGGVLPPSNWIWIAQSEDWDFWPNAPEWEVAFRQSSVEEAPDESFLSSAVLLSGYQHGKTIYGGTVALNAILERLLEHHAARRYSQEVGDLLLQFLRNLKARKFDHLTARDGVIVAQSIATLNAELLLNLDSTLDRDEIDRQSRDSEWIRIASNLKAQLGPRLWNNLDSETQEDFRTSAMIYRRRESLPGEQNFANALFYLSLGLLREINIHFWGPVRACKETKGELLDLGLNGSYPKNIEWSAFLKIIERREALPQTLRVALSRGIDMKWFLDRNHVKEINDCLYDSRQKGAHSHASRIERELGMIRYHEIVKKGGLAQQILEALGVHRLR